MVKAYMPLDGNNWQYHMSKGASDDAATLAQQQVTATFRLIALVLRLAYLPRFLVDAGWAYQLHRVQAFVDRSDPDRRLSG
jgi:hypothetical protein